MTWFRLKTFAALAVMRQQDVDQREWRWIPA